MKNWKAYSKTEQFLIGFIVVLIFAIALNWKRVYNGIKKGIEPYQTEQKQ